MGQQESWVGIGRHIAALTASALDIESEHGTCITECNSQYQNTQARPTKCGIPQSTYTFSPLDQHIYGLKVDHVLL